MPTNQLAGRDGNAAGAVQHVAILFADVVGSTSLFATVGDLAVSQVIKSFFERAKELLEIHHGQSVKYVGDGFMAVFPDVAEALEFATQLQRSLSDNPIVIGDKPLQVRIGLHAGDIRLVQTSYGEDAFGADINVAARLTGIAQPGGVVLSEAVRFALRDEQRRKLGPTERIVLKGVDGPMEVSRVDLSAA